MTTSEELDDPFSAHFKRDPLPGAGIRIVLLTRLAARASGSRHRPVWPSGSPSSDGRSSNGSSPVDGLGLAEALAVASTAPACLWCW